MHTHQEKEKGKNRRELCLNIGKPIKTRKEKGGTASSGNIRASKAGAFGVDLPRKKGKLLSSVQSIRVKAWKQGSVGRRLAQSRGKKGGLTFRPTETTSGKQSMKEPCGRPRAGRSAGTASEE